MIRNLYYEIWVDAITFEKKNHAHLRNWKAYTIMPISIAQGINLLTILMWLRPVGVKVDPFIHFSIFPGTILNSLLSGLMTLFLPFLILNYLFIFRKRRYENLLELYQARRGRLYGAYFVVSMVLFLGPIIVGKWIL